MKRSHGRLAVVIATGLLGCGPPPSAGDPGSDSSGPAGTTLAVGPTTGAGSADSTGSTSTGSTDSGTGVGFLGGSDFPPLCGPIPEGTSAHCDCDLMNPGWCTRGYKCMPWASDGGEIWNATRCSPVARRPAAVGEPCTNEGSRTSGIDDCEHGSMCLFHDEAGVGQCVAICQGSLVDPICNEGTQCFVAFDGVITLCLPPCDPLASECGSGLCIPDDDDGFVCFPAVPPPSELGQACEYDAQCPAQSACTGARPPWWCPIDACTCNALCDLQGMPPEAGCAPGQVCTPWFEAGQEPTGLAHVGHCAG